MSARIGRKPFEAAALAAIAATGILLGCARGPASSGDSASGRGGSTTVQVKGSDTMVNLAQVWAEEYKRVVPEVSVEVSGGGSGVGIAALIKGTIDLATASRNMKPGEIEQARKNTGMEPTDHVIGYDALAIYVHKNNPLEEITFDQIAAIYSESATITRWSQLGVSIPGARSDVIVRVSRQSSSGTYEFLRERVLHNEDVKNGSRDMNGSKEVVELVASAPTAIGYSGMGYASSGVKILKVAVIPGQKAFLPTVQNTLDQSYPIARSLHIFTLGEPHAAAKDFVTWLLSDSGQKLVEATGYVPIPEQARTRK
jgi:phosphate transport system substrate-binding protein